MAKQKTKIHFNEMFETEFLIIKQFLKVHESTRTAMSKRTLAFATNVANKDDHSPHFVDKYKIVHNLKLIKI